MKKKLQDSVNGAVCCMMCIPYTDNMAVVWAYNTTIEIHSELTTCSPREDIS